MSFERRRPAFQRRKNQSKRCSYGRDPVGARRYFKCSRVFRVLDRPAPISSLAVAPSEETLLCATADCQLYQFALSNTDILKEDSNNFELLCPRAAPYTFADGVAATPRLPRGASAGDESDGDAAAVGTTREGGRVTYGPGCSTPPRRSRGESAGDESDGAAAAAFRGDGRRRGRRAESPLMNRGDAVTANVDMTGRAPQVRSEPPAPLRRLPAVLVSERRRARRRLCCGRRVGHRLQGVGRAARPRALGARRGGPGRKPKPVLLLRRVQDDFASGPTPRNSHRETGLRLSEELFRSRPQAS